MPPMLDESSIMFFVFWSSSTFGASLSAFHGEVAGNLAGGRLKATDVSSPRGIGKMFLLPHSNNPSKNLLHLHTRTSQYSKQNKCTFEVADNGTAV